jgi:integrase
VRFYELDVVERIVAAQPTAERRALMALLYGTAIDLSTALGLSRADVNPATKEIRAAGTKAHTRDRVCRVADWAWPIIWEHIRDRLPVARLFRDDLTRWTVSDWHRETVTSLKLPQYPLRNARDHWAVYRLRAGAPVALVQTQLGHGSPMLTLTKYGRFMPSPADRNRWEAEAARVEAERRAVLA